MGAFLHMSAFQLVNHNLEKYNCGHCVAKDSVSRCELSNLPQSSANNFLLPLPAKIPEQIDILPSSLFLYKQYMRIANKMNKAKFLSNCPA